LPEPIRRPAWDLLLEHPAHLLAFGGGAGLAPFAPGTVGTLLAFPAYWLLAPRVSTLQFLLVVVAMFLVGIWACDKTGRALGTPDHGGMVWDELVAFLLVLLFVPQSLAWQSAAFVLFRLFDILKPPPIRSAERALKGGFAVMADDMIAAFYSLLVLAAAKKILG
jgi:phosphatidylglycerophosphatase A